MAVYVHLATGYEEVEALTCVDVLRRAGVDAKMVSVTGELAVRGAHDIDIMADLLFEDADYSSCEMIVLPGGMPGAANLRDHAGLTEKIKEFEAEGRKLAAICAAPLALAAHGALDGKAATIYPGLEDEHLKNAKASHANVTKDGNVITGIGPAIAMEFALALAEELKGKEVRDQVASGLLFDRR
ncbi:MAG: DJ-1/PfpI family protein [Bacillota bacterium]|nr:DJ-1/PfpI family protein [Bacillota bacterium]